MPDYVPKESGPKNKVPDRDAKRGRMSRTTMRQLRQFSLRERKAGRKPILYIPDEIMDSLSKEDRDFIYGY